MRDTQSVDPFVSPTSTPALDAMIVGLPVTYGIGGDRYAMSIVEVRKNGREIVVAHGTPADEEARCRRIMEADGRDTWIAERQIAQGRSTLTRRPNGKYADKGGKPCGHYTFGAAFERRDPSF